MVLCFIKQAVITSSQYWIMNTLLWAPWFPSRGCCPCWSYTHRTQTARSCGIPWGISPVEVAISHYCAWGFSFLVSSGPSTWQGGPGRQVGCMASGERGGLEGAALLLCRASLHCYFSGCDSTVPLNQFVPFENGSGQKPVGSGNMWPKVELLN